MTIQDFVVPDGKKYVVVEPGKPPVIHETQAKADAERITRPDSEVKVAVSYRIKFPEMGFMMPEEKKDDDAALAQGVMDAIGEIGRQVLLALNGPPKSIIPAGQMPPLPGERRLGPGPGPGGPPRLRVVR